MWRGCCMRSWGRARRGRRPACLRRPTVVLRCRWVVLLSTGIRTVIRRSRRTRWPLHVIARCRTITIHQAIRRLSRPVIARLSPVVAIRHITRLLDCGTVEVARPVIESICARPRTRCYAIRISCIAWMVDKRTALSGKLHRWAAGSHKAAIDHSRAARDVSRSVIDDRAVMPAHAPAMPSPAPRCPGTNRNPIAKTDPETEAHADKQSRGRRVVISGPGYNCRSIDHPRVVDRHIHNFWIGWRNRNIAAIVAHRQLRRTLQLAGLLGTLAHLLHGIHHVLRLVVIGIPQIGRPLQVTIHLRKYRREGRQRLHARIPLLGVRSVGNLVSRGIPLRLAPAIGFHNLGWIRGCSKNLRHERVRVKCNGGYELINLICRQGLRLLLLLSLLIALRLLGIISRIVWRRGRPILRQRLTILRRPLLWLLLILLVGIRRRGRNILGKQSATACQNHPSRKSRSQYRPRHT